MEKKKKKKNKQIKTLKRTSQKSNQHTNNMFPIRLLPIFGEIMLWVHSQNPRVIKSSIKDKEMSKNEKFWKGKKPKKFKLWNYMGREDMDLLTPAGALMSVKHLYKWKNPAFFPLKCRCFAACSGGITLTLCPSCFPPAPADSKGILSSTAHESKWTPPKTWNLLEGAHPSMRSFSTLTASVWEQNGQVWSMAG